MSVAFILDFLEGTREQYEEVLSRMELGGHMAAGGKVHCAGTYEGGWRIVDVWDDAASFERFRDEQILPQIEAIGLGPPIARMLEAEEEWTGTAIETNFVQVVILPGLTSEGFHAADEKIRPGGKMPVDVLFHVNGPVEEGWMVIDGWTSKEARDTFMDTLVRPNMDPSELDGPPQVEDLVVEATLAGEGEAR